MSTRTRRSVIILFLIIALFAVAAATLVVGTYDLRLTAGEEAIIYCAGGAFQVEMIDDLTVYVRCYDDTPGMERLYYFPAVGDGNQVKDGN